MVDKGLTKQLELGGNSHTCIWQDLPNAFCPELTHGAGTAPIVLSGELTLTVNGRCEYYTPGGLPDVRAGAVHSAKGGPRGGRHQIGGR